jgi:ABC-2 type transport system ATP-binding protein
MMCDRVSILRRGSVVVGGRLSDLLKSDVQRTDVVLLGASEALENELTGEVHAVRRLTERLVVEVEGKAKVAEVLQRALAAGATVVEVTPRHETLEDLFVREAIEGAPAEKVRPAPTPD